MQNGITQTNTNNPKVQTEQVGIGYGNIGVPQNQSEPSAPEVIATGPGVATKKPSVIKTLAPAASLPAATRTKKKSAAARKPGTKRKTKTGKAKRTSRGKTTARRRKTTRRSKTTSRARTTTKTKTKMRRRRKSSR